MGEKTPTTDPAQTGEAKPKKKRNVDGKKPLTFIYLDKDGKSTVGVHRTKAYNLKMAWKEFKEKHGLGEECIRNHTFPGQMEEIPKDKEEFRKPSREELLELVNMLQSKEK